MKAHQEKYYQLNYSFLTNEIGVSRETCEKMYLYYKLLFEWNEKINLVSRKSIKSSWVRHFLDSSQLWFCLPKGTKSWLDFGSGAGFPGLVISIIANELAPNLRVILVEKNKKKALFLEGVIKKLSLNTKVLCNRIEVLEPQKVDVISARAVGQLKYLIGIAYMHRNDKTLSLFPKGKTYMQELKDSRLYWAFETRYVRNLFEKGSPILEIRNIAVAK